MDYLAKAHADLERLDDVIRRARDTMERAAREREEIAIFIRLHERYSKGGTSVSTPVGIATKQDVVRAKAADIIRAHGARMSIQELYDSLVAAGVEIAGKQPKANLAGMLSRDDRHFEYDKEKGGWWVHDIPESSLIARMREANVAETRVSGDDVLASSDEAPSDDVDGASDHNWPLPGLEAKAAA